MPGFRHSPLDDIARIRQDLRDRYADGFSILKELLQNADDAGADQPGGQAIELVLVLARNGLPGANHLLLRSAGLAVLNDGIFTPEDAISITSLGTSNKAGQAGAAGKFGLGLKSIFHWAEAFFYFSSQTFSDKVPQQAAPCDLLNPWWSREANSGRHQDWEDTWQQNRRAETEAFTKFAVQVLRGERWFGLWIPLRREDHLRDRNEQIKPIEQRFPQADLDQLLGAEWPTRLSETLPLLRRLRRVRVGVFDNGRLEPCSHWEIADGAQRMRFGLYAASRFAPEPQALAGDVRLDDNVERRCHFAGYELLGAQPSLREIKRHSSWPNQTAIGPDGADQQVPEKAEPHGAVVFTRLSSNGPGRLRIQPAVFLPLGEPEEIKLKGDSRLRFSLYLHGFFFVDAGRRHLLQDGSLPVERDPGQLKTETEVMQFWNRTLLREVVAPLVLPSLDAFVKQERMPSALIEALVGAMEKAETLKPLFQWMCRQQRFVFRLHPGGGVWEHEKWNAEAGQPRRWIALPTPEFAESTLFELLPALHGLCNQATVSLEDKPFLAGGKPARPNDSELASLLTGVPIESFENPSRLDYLLKLIPEEAAKRPADSELTKALVQLANWLVGKPLPKDKGLAKAWADFFQRLPSEAIVVLPLISAEVDPKIAEALAEAGVPVAVVWQDFRGIEGKGMVPWSDLLPVLRSLSNLDLADAGAVEQRSKIVVRLLSAASEKPSDWTTAVAALPLFASRSPGGDARASSFRELQEAQSQQRLFTGGKDWAKDLAEAAPKVKPVLIEAPVATVLGLQAGACDAQACVSLLRAANGLATDFAKRKPLFELLLGQAGPGDGDRWKALRCLLHGQIAEWDNQAALVREPQQADAFLKLAKLVLEAAGQSWRLIPHHVDSQLALNDNQRHRLNLQDVSATSAQAVAKEAGPAKLDCAGLTTEECDTILLLFDDVEVLRGLNIHVTPDPDARRVRIEGHTYVDDGSFKDLPEAFNEIVTRIRNRAGYGRECFRNWDGSNRLVNKLDWEAVIRIALDRPDPQRHCDTILTAIGQLGTLRTELRDRVRDVAWLPLADSGAVKPADLLHIPGAEAELDRLPPEVLNGKVPIRRLAEPVRKHGRFDTFTRTVLPPAKDALDALANLLTPHPAWSTGLTGEWSAEQVAGWVAALGDAPAQVMPVAGLVEALHGQEVLHELLPGFLKNIGGRLVEAAYAGVVAHLTARHGDADANEQACVEKVFLRYLKAVDSRGADFAKAVLSAGGVLLQAASRGWKPPAQLVWPSHGVADDDQLHSVQAHALPALMGQQQALLADFHADHGGEAYVAAAQETPDRLRRYFTSWVEFVPREVVGAFICVLGDGPGLRELAEEFLGQNTIAGVRDEISAAATQPPEGQTLQQALAAHRFACVLHEAQTVRLPSILGDTIEVRRGSVKETIFLGSGITAFPRAGEWTQRWLHLLIFNPAGLGGGPEQLCSLLRASAEQILHYVFCQQGINLKPLWDRLGQPAQLHIRIAQNRVADAAQAFLRQVGAHRTQEVVKVLKDWDAADRRRAEAEEAGHPVPAEVQNQLSEARARLRDLLANHGDTQQATLAAVRDKIEGVYGYKPDSTPFEIWQNADDALVELAVLGYDTERATRLGFIGRRDEQGLMFSHWGRLVNEFQGSEGRQFRELGFDEDLEKMVVQAISDKRAGGPRGQAVTGKFGLGFKSVFLVSDAPEVVSGSVDFAIRGGIYPVRLEPERRDELIAVLKELAPDHWRRGTIIRLPWRADGRGQPDQVLALFQRLAPLLVVFSRKLKRLRLRRDGEPEREICWRPVPLAEGLEVGELAHLDGNIRRALVVSRAVDNDRVQLLLGLGTDGFIALPDDVPVFWVTAPTRTTPGYGFAVNGPFEPDVGRVQLALNSKRNEELADELARGLAERLKTLWAEAERDWTTLRDKLGLASSATALGFWESLWAVLGQRFADKYPKSDNSPVAALARRILWQSEHSGIRQLYSNFPALPTGLWGEHRTLTRLPDIRFEAAGALDREEVFKLACRWPAFQRRIKAAKIVSASRVASVLRRLEALGNEPEALHLASIVEWELTQGQELRADPKTAGRVGQVVTEDFLKALKEGKSHEREEQEAKALGELLPKVLCLAADGSWHKPVELVVAGGERVDKDETMRAAFAPPEARLHSDYTGPALEFFLATRPELKAGAETLAEWALRANDNQGRSGSLRYLLAGKLGEELARRLRENRDHSKWIWQLQADLSDWFKAAFPEARDRQEILARRLGYFDQQVQQLMESQEQAAMPPPPEPPPKPWTVEELWLWWEGQGTPTGDYVLEGEANWPLFHGGPIWDEAPRKAELKRLLLDPTSAEGRLLWYRLFGYACLVSAGRTVTELRRFWLDRLEPAGFWIKTGAGDFSDETREIFEQAVTAEFNNLNAGGEQAYFWRRVFYDIRKVHQMVQNDFPAVLLDLVHQGRSEHLRQFLRTGHLPGPEQPRWIGTFGQSADTPLGFIIRELLRLGVIQDEAVRPSAFYVCRPVLRALEKIGWFVDEELGYSGQQWLNELNKDPEYGPKFLPYFDIPLLHMGITHRGRKMPHRPTTAQ